MINIFKVEVSTNGRTHILHSEDTSIEVNNKIEMEKKRKELKEKYEKELGFDNLTMYLSYIEK